MSKDLDEDRIVRYVVRDTGGLFLMKKSRRTGVKVEFCSDVHRARWWSRPGNARNAIESMAPTRSLRVVRLDIFLTEGGEQ